MKLFDSAPPRPGRLGRRPDRKPSRAARLLRVALMLSLFAAGTLFVGALASAASRSSAVTPGSRYLALGDSVTFGYEEPNVVPAPNYHNASSFLGYPEQLGAELHLNVANAACPGETSSSLINASAQSNGCEKNALGNTSVSYRKLDPLHVSYRGAQLTYALGYLAAHRDVRLVSLMIGANDLYRCRAVTKDQCAAAAEQRAVFATLAGNTSRILAAIRDKAQYRGQLAIVNYYSLDYASATDDALSIALNKTVDAAAKPFDVVIADGYGALQAASVHSRGDTCAAGLLNQLGSPGTCGIHPSYAGQALLAQALEKAIRL